MPGFRITNLKTKCGLYDYKYAKTVRTEMIEGNWNVSRNTLDKFLDDKVWLNEDDYIITLEGVVLNSVVLIRQYGGTSWIDAVKMMVSTQGLEWFRLLEGPVSGAVYYKHESRWCVFTSKLGEKAIFYYADNGNYIIGSQLKYVSDVMHELGIAVSPDENALKHFMAYGSYIGTETCISGVTRLYPGEYLIIDGMATSTHQYCKYDICQDQEPKSEGEYIEMLDAAFRGAIQRIVDKNAEYGYVTVADISGGYDSRLNCYVLKALGAENVIMDCYAQTGCHDHRVSEAIASELGYDYVFRSMDTGDCLYGIDDNVLMLNGASSYAGITGGRDMLHTLSGLEVGLEVTGLLGDVHDGSMVTDRCDGDINGSLYRDSITLSEGTDYSFPVEENRRFEQHVNEHFWFYNRGMIAGMSSFFIRQSFLEPVTPYGDSEFLNVYLSIPWNMRVKGKLLRKWMAYSYPGSSEYTNARTGLKLKYDILPAYSFPGKIYKQYKKYQMRICRGRIPIGMNDVEYWYRNQDKLRDYLNGYISDNISLVDDHKNVSHLIDKLLSTGTVIDKLNAISVLSLFRNYIV